MKKLSGKSLDITHDNIDKLKELFPNVVVDNKVDFDKLRLVLGENIDDSVEKYQFTWPGKADSIRLAQSPSTKTLRPSIEESKNWDITENIYIEGDNLEVLKQLQKSYYKKVDVIYIDPPYNTGNDFVYSDKFAQSLEDYKEESNQGLISNPETSGKYHSNWLNMMYPRLVLARNLLHEEGIIVVSIDDSEVNNLQKIMDEIFGEQNLVNKIVVKMSELSGVKMANLKKFPKLKEYLLIYSTQREISLDLPKELKSRENLIGYMKYYSNIIVNIEDDYENWDIQNLRDYYKKNNLLLSNEEEYEWKIKNSNRLVYRTNSRTVEKAINDNPNLPPIYKIINNDGKEIYKWDDKEMLFLEQYLEQYLGDIWMDISTINLNKENCGLNYFQNGQKPLKLLERIINLKDDDSLVMDFFSGSASTAHAVMSLNSKDNGSRKFIMVQIEEETNEKSNARKDGYYNICEIGKERIRRAGNEIKTSKKSDNTLFEKKSNIDTLDIGFKVFKLDETNIRAWQGSKIEDDKITSLLDQLEDVFKEDRTHLDVVYEIMLKYGVFDMEVEEANINGKTMYDIGKGYMLICLEENINNEDVVEIGNLGYLHVVFNDKSFENDNVKLNAEHTLKNMGVEEVVSI